MFEYKLTNDDIKLCEKHAQLMSSGAKTYSFKDGKYQSTDVYLTGKIGELVCLKYFRYLEKKDQIIIKHLPFRDSYDSFNWNDDFIITSTKTYQDTQIEVRTKGRNVDPQPNYTCCTDQIKPTLNYWFVSYNRKTNTAFIVGWADWEVLKKHAFIIYKGHDNGIYVNKTTEFQIEIGHLNDVKQRNISPNLQLLVS